MKVARSPAVIVTALGVTIAVALASRGGASGHQQQAPPPSQAPQQQKPPTFRSLTTVVPVTVTVLDKKGKPVTDLKQSDFTVYQDDKVREIVTFLPQAFAPDPASLKTPGPLNRTAPASAPLTPQTRRTFLFVFGFGRIQYPTEAVEASIAFVRKQLLPQDLVALIAFNRATDLTTDHDQVARIMERYLSKHEKIVFDVNEHYARHPGGVPAPPLPQWIQDDIDSVFTGEPPPGNRKWYQPADPANSPPSLRSATDLLLGVTRATTLRERPHKAAATYAEVATLVYRGSNIPLSDAVIRGSLLKAYAGIEYLRYLEGEKHLVFLGRGLAVPGEPGVVREGASGWDKTDDERLARRSGDARVALQIIHTAGTPPGRRMFLEAERIQSSQWMAELTGGSFTSVRMAADQLAAIDESTRFSYLIGYTPVNPELDGQFRRVRVVVNRPDLTVRYQHGYYADETPPDLLKELLVSSRLNTAASIAQTASSIKVTVTARMLPRMGVNEVARVEVLIDPSQIAFEVADGIRTGTVDVQVYGGDEKERVVGSAAGRIELKATEQEYAEWLRTGFRHAVRLTLTAAPRHIKVVVYDFGSDRVGSAMYTIGK